MTAKDSSVAGSKPMTPFVHTRPANNEVHKKVWKIKEYLTEFEPIIQNGRAQPCWSEYRRSFVNDIIPFYENIKNLSQNLDTDIYTKVKEFERNTASTKIETNLSNDNERFIADNIAKDICSFVLSSEKQVSPRSNCSEFWETQNHHHRMLNVGPTTGSLDQQALETEVTQLKDALTSLLDPKMMWNKKRTPM
ncbi:hypothetical protein Tco_1091858 [Tanacetum coccineum]|uniref:Uncharacterized protein n=1 Tax=Tanacetum coccineum TaxID=301880 RepID=A0ABQ5I8G0_9ASTR